LHNNSIQISYVEKNNLIKSINESYFIDTPNLKTIQLESIERNTFKNLKKIVIQKPQIESYL